MDSYDIEILIKLETIETIKKMSLSLKRTNYILSTIF